MDKMCRKNIPLFFQKHHEEFLKTSNVFLKTTVCFLDMYNLFCVSLLMLMICLLENANTNQWGIIKKYDYEFLTLSYFLQTG